MAAALQQREARMTRYRESTWRIVGFNWLCEWLGEYPADVTSVCSSYSARYSAASGTNVCTVARDEGCKTSACVRA
jgi:hypothetical protein